MTEQMSFKLPDCSDKDRLSLSRGDSIRTISWSYSRRGTLEQCPRRYYYTYYASNGRTRALDPETRYLSQLQNRHERTGQILHLVISTFLRKSRLGDSWSTHRLCNWAEYLFRSDCEYSKLHSYENAVNDNDKNATLLQEFYYKEPDADALCTAAMARLLSAIKEFAENPAFLLFRESALNPEALIECFIKINGLPCGVSGRVDLAYKEKNEVVIVDWKMGGSQVGDDSLQLATYAMWSLNRFSADCGNMRIHKALLVDGQLTTSRVDETMLARARVRIIQDAELMGALDTYGREGTVGAFTPCLQPAVCALCRFRKLCRREGMS